MRILVVEDELKAAEYLHQGLTESGYVVDHAATGADGLHLAQQQAYDLIILDVNLPELDGWGVLEQLRRTHSTRVMMLTARGRLADKIRGLDLGADDYLVKPFEFPELLARVRTLMRRSENIPVPQVLKVADLELDPGRHRAFRGAQRIDLTTKEFALLHLLMRQSGEVLTRTQIISLVWDMNFDCDTNVVEVSIRRLRAKIDDPFEQQADPHPARCRLRAGGTGMKPSSLSMRLGLTVSILGALLVVFLAILAYFALTHELNALSRDSLEKKMAQVEHSLSLYVDANEISGKPHILLDQVMGHDNLTLTIYDRLNLRSPLLKSGSGTERIRGSN